MIWACKGGKTETVEYLVSQGFNVNEKDNEGRNGLHWAADNCNLPLVKFLITNGIDYKHKSNNSETAFQPHIIQKNLLNI